MTLTVERTGSGDRTALSIIDCDIHNTAQTGTTLHKYLPERWRRYAETYGGRSYSGANYPRANLNAARTDSWPPSGLPPGSDLDFLRHQLLDEWNLEYGVLNPLNGAGGLLHPDFAAAMSTATNDWQVEEWLDREPRLRASIVVPWEDGELSAAEIDHRARDPRFIQALLIARTHEPLGRRKYWKLYEAAERNNLPVGIHFGGAGGGPITGAGWPSFYIEDHAGMPTSFETQVTSLVCEGVFEAFPKLKIVLIEGGFSWLPPLMWRLDRAYKKLHDEVPQLTRLPSEYIRDHFWLTTQPMEEPHKPKQFHQLLEHLNMNDRLMFATDYPHWDFDAPDRAIATPIDRELEVAIMAGNAKKLYGLA